MYEEHGQFENKIVLKAGRRSYKQSKFKKWQVKLQVGKLCNCKSIAPHLYEITIYLY